MFGIVEGDVDAVRLVPQAGVGVGVKQFDLLARLFERDGRPAIRPAAQEAGPGLRPMPPALGAQDMLEPAPHQRVGVNHRQALQAHGWHSVGPRATADALQQTQLH